MNHFKLSLIIFILFFNFSSCRKRQDINKNVLNLALTGEISTLDPAVSFDTVSGSIVGQIYEPLFQYHYLKRPYSIEPLIAEKMPETINDGLSFKITIKKNIFYHDNECFNGQKREVIAQDFVNQIKRIAFKPTISKGWWLFKNKIIGLDDFREEAKNDINKLINLRVKGLEVLSKYQFVIHLKEKYPQLIYALTMNFTVPIPSEVIRCLKNDLSDKTVGTGPYLLKKWLKKHSLKLTKNDFYRNAFYPSVGDRKSHDKGLLRDSGKKIPFIKDINFSIIKEANTRWLNFMAQKIDMLPVPKDNFDQVFTPMGNLAEELTKKKIKIDISPSSVFWWLSFNMKDPVVGGYEKNKKFLRKAIAHAINVDRFIKIFTNNLVLKANSIYPPGVPGYNPNSTLPYKYDLELSKMYMKKAGYDISKNKMPLSIFFDVRGNDTTRRQVAEFIKQELKQIGIDVKIRLNTFPAFLKKADEGKLQFWQDGWALDYIDAENVVQLLVSKSHPPGPNSTFYSRPEVDKYFNELKYLRNSKRKYELMSEIEKNVNDDLVWIMLYYSRNYVLYHDRVKNYKESDIVYNYLKYLNLK